MRSLALATTLVAFMSCQAPSSPPVPAAPDSLADPDPLAALEGRWVWRGPRNIIGRGMDEIWGFARGAEGWELVLTVVRYPSVNEDDRSPRAWHYPPRPVRVEDQRLCYTDPRYPREPEWRVTFAVRDGALKMPAWIETDGRRFEYESWHEQHRLHFDHDPRRVAAGTLRAWNLGALGSGPLTYAAGVAPVIWQQDREAFTVQVYEDRPLEGLTELGRLIWSEYGQPWYFGPGGSPTYADRALERLSAEEWQRVLAFELRDPQARER